MKLSQVTLDIIRDYLRIPEVGPELPLIRDAALHYIRTYTGLGDAQLEDHEDLSIALLVLCAELYDNRQMSVQNGRMNPVIEQILSAHAVNLV